jgi:hypothetical protein
VPPFERRRRGRKKGNMTDPIEIIEVIEADDDVQFNSIIC